MHGKFNIRFFGPKVWNDIDESLKNPSYRGFKRKIKAQYFISSNSDNQKPINVFNILVLFYFDFAKFVFFLFLRFNINSN